MMLIYQDTFMLTYPSSLLTSSSNLSLLSGLCSPCQYGHSPPHDFIRLQNPLRHSRILV